MLEIDDNEELIQKRLRHSKQELPKYEQEFLTDMVEADYPFIIDPMPNLYFTRDNFATMGHGISLNHMYSVTRQRETIFGQYILIIILVSLEKRFLESMIVQNQPELKVAMN